MSSLYTVFAPNSTHPSLSSKAVPYASLLGSWSVIASTLPLWRDKKNVTITYSLIDGEAATTFDDLVSYNNVKDAAGKAPSTIKGVDRLDVSDAEAGNVNVNAARWKWRGKGWLMIASSSWQLLGYSLHPVVDSKATSPEWVVTYFASTLFTPAGLDIYSRNNGRNDLSDEAVAAIVRELEKLGGTVGELAKDGKMFRVPRD